ncbi:MAG: toprim domain-containing protein, partial [Cyanobacteria bacterium J06641_2]
RRVLIISCYHFGPEVIAAYDKDSAGNQIARDIQKLLPQTTIKQPIEKDWNQQLLELIRSLRVLEREAKQEKKEKKVKNKGLEL